MLFPSVLNRVSTLATSDTKRSLKTRRQPSRIPTNAGLERPSGRKILESSTKFFSLSLAEVRLVLGPGRSWSSTTSLDYTPPAANASITTGASAGTGEPSELPPAPSTTPWKNGARRPSAGGGSLSHRRAAPPQHTPRTWAAGPRRISADTPRFPEPRQRCRGAQGLQHPAPALLHRASSRPGRPRSPYPPG